MHDTLKYFMKDPIHRKHHQNDLTFRMLYAYKRELHSAAVARRGGAGEGPLWDKMGG